MQVSNSSKAAYGRVPLRPLGSLLDVARFRNASRRSSELPLTFEEVGLDRGFALYETTVGFRSTDPAKLEIRSDLVFTKAIKLLGFLHFRGVADRAYVFAGGRFRGVLSRWGDITSMPISVRRGDELQVPPTKVFNQFR